VMGIFGVVEGMVKHAGVTPLN